MTLARANIEPEAWTDPRFLILAKAAGFGPGEAGREVAIVRCAKIWAWQTANYTPDEPTYVLSADIIESFLAVDNAAQLMVHARLAEEVPEGFRIKGGETRVEWLWKLSQNGKKGGAATKEKWQRQKAPDGARKRSRANKTGPVAPAIATATASAVPSLLDLDLDLPRRERAPRARDPAESAVPSTEHGPSATAYMAPEHPRPEAIVDRDPKPPNVIALDPRVRLRDEILRSIPDEHTKLYNRARLELGSNARPMGVVGEPAERALRELLEKLPVLDGVLENCRHVLAIRYHEAIRKRTLSYFREVVWRRECYDRACSMTLAEAGDEVRDRERGERDRERDARAGPGRSPARGASALSSLLDSKNRHEGTT